MNRLQQPHFLEQFKGTDAAASLHHRLGRLDDAFLEVIVTRANHESGRIIRNYLLFEDSCGAAIMVIAATAINPIKSTVFIGFDRI